MAKFAKNPQTSMLNANSSRSKPWQIYPLAGLVIVFSLIVYTWFISAGSWTNWPTVTQNYDRLATSFLHGRTWLDRQPSPALLAMPDPYDYAARKAAKVSFIWDTSLYKGKFYLYWEPLPAIILAAIKFVFPHTIGDQYLLFGFLAGLLMFETLFILKLRRQYYEDIPTWVVLICILLSALVYPIPEMLKHPAIYEAAIAGGQFFLIGGLYFAWSALEKKTSDYINLMLAGIFWVCAIGSRATLLIPVAFLIFMTFVMIANHDGKSIKDPTVFSKFMMMLLPVGLGGLGLAWYNWVRFGSIFETGIRYQLTIVNFYKDHDQSFSWLYMVPNLWNYILNPAAVQSTFPFLIAQNGQSRSFIAMAKPGIFQSDVITGLLFSVPFLLFSLITVSKLLPTTSPRGSMQHSSAVETPAGKLLTWISISLAGIGILSLITALFFFFSIARYLADITPSLLLFSMLGLWQGYHLLKQRYAGRNPYLFLVLFMCLAVPSILVSLLLAMTG